MKKKFWKVLEKKHKAKNFHKILYIIQRFKSSYVSLYIYKCDVIIDMHCIWANTTVSNVN